MKTKRNNYTPSEAALLKAMPGDGSKISSADLTDAWKRTTKKRIAHPRNAVSGTMRALIKKVARNREDFRIKRTPRSGPYSIEYWVEKR